MEHLIFEGERKVGRFNKKFATLEERREREGKILQRERPKKKIPNLEPGSSNPPPCQKLKGPPLSVHF